MNFHGISNWISNIKRWLGFLWTVREISEPLTFASYPFTVSVFSLLHPRMPVLFLQHSFSTSQVISLTSQSHNKASSVPSKLKDTVPRRASSPGYCERRGSSKKPSFLTRGILKTLALFVTSEDKQFSVQLANLPEVSEQYCIFVIYSCHWIPQSSKTHFSRLVNPIISALKFISETISDFFIFLFYQWHLGEFS